VFLKVEPAGFFMYTVRLTFDLDRPDTEDQQVRDYLTEHELQPRHQWTGDFEGSQGEFMQFGSCYLGQHLQSIGQIVRRVVEVELLTEQIEQHLNSLSAEEIVLSEEQRRAAITALVGEFHQDSVFQANENGELIAVLDGSQVQQAARRVLAALAGA
jgi:muconolactone delta-isomerase